MKLTKLTIQKKTLAYTVAILLILGGFHAYRNLGRLEFPSFTIKTAVVMTSYPGASSIEVEQEVTDSLETAIQQLSQVKEVRSMSKAGLSIIYVDIKDSYPCSEIPQIWDELRRKVSDSKTMLPPGGNEPVVVDDFGDEYGVFFAVYGDGYTYKELKDYADLLKRELLLVKDVASVEIWGNQPEVIYFEISRARLAELGISIIEIVNTLNRQNQVMDSGSISVGNDYVRITPTGNFGKVSDLGELLIRSDDKGNVIYLKDIADIKRSYLEPAQSIMRYNGKPAIGLGIATTANGNVVEMGEAVAKRIEELKYKAPVGMELGIIAYQSETVTKAVDSFIINLIEAVFIVIVILCITMGASSGFLMGAILILTIMGTFIYMRVADISLQLISLGALILALGMLVDNAIVVTEGILVRVQQGMGRKKAAVETVSQTAWPLLAATFVAILAFAAIGASRDTTGEFLGSLFQVMAASLCLSWILAITLTPLFCVQFIPKVSEQDATVPYTGIFYQAYRRSLDYCLHHKTLTLAVLIGILIIGIYGFSHVEESFFPNSRRPQFMIDYFRPEGTHINKTSDDLKQIESYIGGLDGVSATTTFVGRGALRFLLTYNPEMPNSSYGQILISVSDYKQIDAMIPIIRDHLILHYPDAEVKFTKFALGAVGGAKIEARFIGPDPSILRMLSYKTQAVMVKDPYAINVRDDWRQKVKVIRPELAEAQARRIGISRPDIASALSMATSGKTIGVYRENNQMLPIVVRAPLHERQSENLFTDIQVFNAITGQNIHLEQITNGIQTIWEDPVIRRENRRRTITVQCDQLSGNASALFERLRPEIEAIHLPDGYQLEWGGEYEHSNDARKSLFKMIPIYFLAMIVTIIGLFNGIRQTVIIFLCLPLATIGVAAGLLITGEPFGFMCLLGFLGLSGMLIKNAVVLIDQIDFEIQSGVLPDTAILNSSISRMRPVLMAALTTILGMLPLIFDPFYAGMSITIMSGLAFGTLLTLFVVPVLYALFFNIQFKKETLFVLGILILFSPGITAQEKTNSVDEDRVITIEQAVEAAINTNFQIKAVQAEQLKAEANRKSALADLLPSAEANYTYTGFRDQPIRKSSGMEIPVSHDNLYHWDVTIIQPFFTGFATSSRYQMAKLGEEIKALEKDQTVLIITQKVKSAYYQVLLAQKLLSVTQETVQALNAHKDNAEAYFAQDLIPENDLLKSQVALAQALQEKESAAANVIMAKSHLNILIGMDIDDNPELVPIDQIEAFKFSFQDLIEEAMNKRPILKMQKLGMESCQHAVTLAKSRYYPQISLIGMYEQDGKDPDASENDFSNQDNALVMAQAKWTFFKWGKTRADVFAARQEKHAQSIRLHDFEDQIKLEVKRAFLALDVSQKNIQTALQALEQARENWRITKLQFDQQVANSADVLDARSFLTQADSNYYRALYGYLISLSELEKSIGSKKGL